MKARGSIRFGVRVDLPLTLSTGHHRTVEVIIVPWRINPLDVMSDMQRTACSISPRPSFSLCHTLPTYLSPPSFFLFFFLSFCLFIYLRLTVDSSCESWCVTVILVMHVQWLTSFTTLISGFLTLKRIEMFVTLSGKVPPCNIMSCHSTTYCTSVTFVPNHQKEICIIPTHDIWYNCSKSPQYLYRRRICLKGLGSLETNSSKQIGDSTEEKRRKMRVGLLDVDGQCFRIDYVTCCCYMLVSFNAASHHSHIVRKNIVKRSESSPSQHTSAQLLPWTSSRMQFMPINAMWCDEHIQVNRIWDYTWKRDYINNHANKTFNYVRTYVRQDVLHKCHQKGKKEKVKK